MSKEEKETRQQEFGVNWFPVLWYINLHFLLAYSIWLIFTEAKWLTLIYAFFITAISCIGVTIGVHRYYAHRTFTAIMPLRVFFVIAHTLAGVGTIYDWVLLHRIHHKYFGTNKDPYNFNKGFLYVHFTSNFKKGFLEQPELVKSVDMRDIELDGYVWLQQKFYWPLFILVTMLLPANIPMAYWNESITNTLFIVIFLRLLIAAHVSWLVNSAILVWGLKPTDKYPVDDYSVFYVKKSYWPNYHYLFPRDWKSGEFGKYDTGCGTVLIKLWYELGFVNMMTTLSSEHVREALYKIASKKASTKEALAELEKLSEAEAISQKLHFWH